MADVPKYLEQIQAERSGADETLDELMQLFAEIHGRVHEDNIACALWITQVASKVPRDKGEVFWQGVAALAVSRLYRERGERMEAE